MQICENGDRNVPFTILPGIIDGIMHILVGIGVGILATHFKLKKIILLSLISEIFIDSFHIVNKAFTHNIFLLIEIPLLIVLFAYIFDIQKLKDLGIGIQGIFLSHFVLDTMVEGDSIMLFYPLSLQVYVWNGTHSPLVLLPLFLIYGVLNWKGLELKLKAYLTRFGDIYYPQPH